MQFIKQVKHLLVEVLNLIWPWEGEGGKSACHKNFFRTQGRITNSGNFSEILFENKILLQYASRLSLVAITTPDLPTLTVSP